MSETKTREPQFALPDELPEDQLPEPVALTPEQIAARAEAEERDREPLEGRVLHPGSAGRAAKAPRTDPADPLDDG
jgi:hypothetical protein